MPSETTREALLDAIAGFAKEDEASAADLLQLAQAWALLASEEEEDEEEKPIHQVGSTQMLEFDAELFWNDGARVCGFTQPLGSKP